MANPSVYCASYNAINPIHCTLTLKETDVSLKGPKYHNLMEERLLQSRLNHLENQLRRTTLVTQRQQLHIQKTLNNIPKPSKNLDRRVAEAFRFIMAEEVFSIEDQKKRAASDQVPQPSQGRLSSHNLHGENGSSDSSSSFEDKSRLLRVVRRRSNQLKRPEVSDTGSEIGNERWKMVRRKLIPAIRFQRRVLVMEPGRRVSLTGDKQISKWSAVSHSPKGMGTGGSQKKGELWKKVAKATQEKTLEKNTRRVPSSTESKRPSSCSSVKVQQQCPEKVPVWKTITYRRRTSDDVYKRWKGLVGAINEKNKKKVSEN